MMKKMISGVLSAAMLATAVPMTIPTMLMTVSAEEKAEQAPVMKIAEIGEDYIVVTTDNGKLQLNVGDETILIDSETKSAISFSDLKEGDVIFCEYSAEMTKSIPPQAGAELIAINTQKGGAVNLIEVDELQKDEDGNVIVTDEDKALELTISKSASVKPYKTRNIVKLDDIQEDTKLLAWYDVQTLSLPAQATTESVVLIGEEVFGEDIDIDDEKEDKENNDENNPSVEISFAETNVTTTVTVSEIGEDFILTADEEGNELQLNIGDETIIIDSETKTALELTDLNKGDKLLCEHSEAQTKSIPPQVGAVLIAANYEKGGNVSLVEVDEVKKDEDGNVIVTDEDKALELTISKSASVKTYKTRNIVKLDDIQEGSVILAWYDVVSMSIPARAATEAVVLVAEGRGDMSEDASDWAKEDIKFAEKLGIFKSLILFCKNDINREEFCELVYNIIIDRLKDIAADKDCAFDDTDNEKIKALAKIGIISGKGDNKFAPNDCITREEAASIMCRVLDLIGVKGENAKTEPAYSDDEQISDWAKDSVYTLTSLKLMSGTDVGFVPKSNITVEQATAILMRLYRNCLTK